MDVIRAVIHPYQKLLTLSCTKTDPISDLKAYIASLSHDQHLYALKFFFKILPESTIPTQKSWRNIENTAKMARKPLKCHSCSDRYANHDDLPIG